MMVERMPVKKRCGMRRGIDGKLRRVGHGTLYKRQAGVYIPTRKGTEFGRMLLLKTVGSIPQYHDRVEEEPRRRRVAA